MAMILGHSGRLVHCVITTLITIEMQTDLMNKVFSYSVDVSNVGCSCNAAAYFINMPGNNAGDGDYYCDANYVGGVG